MTQKRRTEILSQNEYLIKSANSIYHDEFRQELLAADFFHHLLKDEFPALNDPSPFAAEFPKWIQSSRLNSFTGLDVFQHRYISLGVTQALDEWHSWIHESGRRLRIWKGEYPYNREVQTDWKDSQFLDNEPLSHNDSVIISLPFSATGAVHQKWSELLVTCERLDVPVFVDCAFFGTCSGIEVDLSHPAVQGVAFSTTKGLGSGNWRAGMTFSRLRLPHLHVQNEWRHGIHLNVQTGLFLMRRHSPDFIYETYQAAQSMVCEHLGLAQTPCVHLATGDNSWHAYSRDGVANRIGIARAVRDCHRLGRIPDRLLSPPENYRSL